MRVFEWEIAEAHAIGGLSSMAWGKDYAACSSDVQSENRLIRPELYTRC